MQDYSLIIDISFVCTNLNNLKFSMTSQFRNPLWLVTLIGVLSFAIWQLTLTNFASIPLLYSDDADVDGTGNPLKLTNMTGPQLGLSDSVKGIPASGIDRNTFLPTESLRSLVVEVATQDARSMPHLHVAKSWPAPRIIPIEELPAAYRGPAPELEVLGH